MIGRTNVVIRNNTSIGDTVEKSLILPSTPIINGVIVGDSEITLKWTQPETEVDIEYYNIYYSLNEPSSLKDMIKAGNTTSNSYTLNGLTNDIKYYLGVQAVSVDGYENASMWEIKNGIPTPMRFVCVGG